jgi:hypothetical protein
MSAGSVTSEQGWVSFVRFARAGNRFAPEYAADASPVPVLGGGALSHSTLFSPEPLDCGGALPTDKCDENENFIDEHTMTRAVGEVKLFTFTFVGAFFDEPPQTQSCVVTINALVLDQWLANKWFIAPCRQASVRATSATQGPETWVF